MEEVKRGLHIIIEMQTLANTKTELNFYVSVDTNITDIINFIQEQFESNNRRYTSITFIGESFPLKMICDKEKIAAEIQRSFVK